jgi:hypothetical protein
MYVAPLECSVSFRCLDRSPNELLSHTLPTSVSLPFAQKLARNNNNHNAQVYNQNGRVGIYTPLERAAIIARFHQKRTNRNWNKKIRYNCRKSLADRRLRVKGRFVRRSEQEQLQRVLETASGGEDEDVDDGDYGGGEQPPVPDDDQDMPDVNDPEAGFAPTADQPYRRLRRHTVT